MRNFIRKIIRKFTWKDFLLTFGLITLLFFLFDFFIYSDKNYELSHISFWVFLLSRSLISAILMILLTPAKKTE
ncbi:hypothetical protein FRZ67_22325 [Panacibacter ginsenosidivorans]|uniref:Uncharacterized protein n=1 Tax=Panacibacter ginsenosidivorans TaxID=1813871 RepID=A0A5B8VHY6_9BACT|nr:hypothetical protein [Panacibacter ginsenosidivorans]QEC69898.1 hypothetical protein FRZ67_22325 [Panacibacter ginsenosidivorans]